MFAYSWDDNDDEIGQPTTGTWVDAACRDGVGSLTALFFSDEIPDIELAKAICSTCSLVVPCLQGALARREPAGVWGGQLFADGQVIARKRKRGRPPKVAAAVPSEQTLPKESPIESARRLRYKGAQRKTA
ncbi:MAG: WhiB family transcriptional regulator [Acidimicrobiales bacterium]|jgi:WhiB family transcriptional regulator, redox-sensing transcriptional regulator